MFRGRRELLGLFSIDERSFGDMEDIGPEAIEEIEKAAMEDSEEAIDHGILVANLALRLAQELKFDEDFCNRVAEAGIVHDIGKLLVPQEVMDKPSRLGSAEKNILHRITTAQRVTNRGN